MFNKKAKEKREDIEEERRCGNCIRACSQGAELFCAKKKKQIQSDECCSAYEYDLLKRAPAPPVRLADWNDEAKEEQR